MNNLNNHIILVRYIGRDREAPHFKQLVNTHSLTLKYGCDGNNDDGEVEHDGSDDEDNDNDDNVNVDVIKDDNNDRTMMMRWQQVQLDNDDARWRR